MKNRLSIIIGIIFTFGMIVTFLFFPNGQQNTCEQMGGKWNDDYCSVTQEIFDLNKLTCDPGPVLENNICTSNGVTLVITSETTLSEDVDDFDKTWGGPGNRHPAFLGYDIPEICSNEMIKHLVRYSNMFENQEHFMLEWISLPNEINKEQFNQCKNELLAINYPVEPTSESEFEVQRAIAKQIYKSLPKDDDSPYLGMILGDDRKSIQFGIDITKLTPEKNKEYYEKLFEEKFSEIISYKVVFKERQGGDE